MEPDADIVNEPVSGVLNAVTAVGNAVTIAAGALPERRLPA